MNWLLKMRYIIGSLVLSVSTLCFSCEPAFTQQNALQYFNGKEYLAVVMRIDGGIHYGEYFLRLSRANSGEYDRVKASNDWRSMYDETETAQFLVLRQIKGELDPVINVELDELILIHIPLGEVFIAFMENTESDDIYRIIPNEIIGSSPERINEIDSRNIDSLIEYFAEILSPWPIRQ